MKEILPFYEVITRYLPHRENDEFYTERRNIEDNRFLFNYHLFTTVP